MSHSIDDTISKAMQFARDDKWDAEIEAQMDVFMSSGNVSTYSQLQELCIANIRATNGAWATAHPFLDGLWRLAHGKHKQLRDAVCCPDYEDSLIYVLERTCDRALVERILDHGTDCQTFMRLNSTGRDGVTTPLSAMDHRWIRSGMCSNPHCHDDQVALTRLLLRRGACPNFVTPEPTPTLLWMNAREQTPLMHLISTMHNLFRSENFACVCRIAAEHFRAGADVECALKLLVDSKYESLWVWQPFLAEAMLQHRKVGPRHVRWRLRKLMANFHTEMPPPAQKDFLCDDGRVRGIRLAFRWLLRAKRLPPWIVGMICESFVMSCFGLDGLQDLIHLRFALQHELQPAWRDRKWMGRCELLACAKWSHIA
jgi:hypothetical protein